jgi:hypothetical protein
MAHGNYSFHNMMNYPSKLTYFAHSITEIGKK